MPSSPQPKPNDDAYLALSSNGTWVNNADTKIGFLVTALSVLTVAAVKQRPRVEALLDAGVHSRGVLSLVLLAVCAVFLVVAGAWLFTALRPRLDNDKASRFAFPHLADADLDELADYDPEEVRREAWMQAQTLAKIGLGKYRRFNNALFCSLAAGLGFLGWLLVVPAT